MSEIARDTLVSQLVLSIPLPGLSTVGKWDEWVWNWDLGICMLMLLHFHFATPGYIYSYCSSGQPYWPAVLTALDCCNIRELPFPCWPHLWGSEFCKHEKAIRWISPPLLPKSPLLLSAQGRWHWPRNAAAFLHWGKVNPKSLQGFYPPLGNFVKGENCTSYKLWGLLLLNRNYYKILKRVTVCWSWERICSDPGLSHLVFCIQTDRWWTPRDE